MVEQKISYPLLDTPVILVNLDSLEANIGEMSRQAAKAGLRLRPHIKVHENVSIARMQIDAGACGVEVGTVEQAEAMVEQGINDIIIAHPGFYGGPKGDILKRLLTQTWLNMALVVDMREQAEIISRIGQDVDKEISLCIKIDLGRSSRFGVMPDKPVLTLAHDIRHLPRVKLVGIYGHEMGIKPTPEGKVEVAIEAAKIMTENARMLKKEGFSIIHVSVGASSTFRATCHLIKEGEFTEITEIHPGQCVIGDIMYLKAGGNVRETCAITVLTTVMSTSHPDWAVIDAGYKTFGADSLIAYRDTPGFLREGNPSYGYIQERPDLWFGRMSAETSCIYYTDPEKKLQIGERLEIIPNNATLVVNIHDRIYGVRNGMIEKIIAVTGRGRGN